MYISLSGDFVFSNDTCATDSIVNEVLFVIHVLLLITSYIDVSLLINI